MKVGFALAVAALMAGAVLASAAPGRAPPPPAAPAPPAKPEEHAVLTQPPPFSEGIFPCTQCHEGEPDATRRELQFHDEIQAKFDHDAEHRWCLDCHHPSNRDVLRLASGATVPFTESYRLCGQCHGDKYRDWRSGVHGKRVGQWDGKKTWFLCVNCHDPHSPAFAPLAPEPRPLRPEEMRR
jgi:hypothetical protein